MEDLEDLVELLLPRRNCILIALRKQGSSEYTPVVLLDDLLPDTIHGSVIETLVILHLRMHIPSPTHAFSRSIASSTVLLGSSDSVPFNPRSSASHASPQDNPRPT